MVIKLLFLKLISLTFYRLDDNKSMLNLNMDFITSMLTLTLFLLGNRGSIYYYEQVSNLCLATLRGNNQWEPSKEINVVMSISSLYRLVACKYTTINIPLRKKI